MTKIKEINRLRIVTLDPPYDSWNNLLAREFFNQSVEVKLRGFAAEYPYGIMPVDTCDFISHHHLICRESSKGLEALCAFKTMSLSKSLIHNVTFPALSLVHLAGTERHVEAVESIMREALVNKKELLYNASLTMNPNTKGNKVLRKSLMDIFKAIYILFAVENDMSEIIAGGTMRFKVHQMLDWMGHSPLTLQSKNLDPIHVEHLAKEQVLVMHLKSFSNEALEFAENWRHLWDNRMIVQELDLEIKKAA